MIKETGRKCPVRPVRRWHSQFIMEIRVETGDNATFLYQSAGWSVDLNPFFFLSPYCYLSDWNPEIQNWNYHHFGVLEKRPHFDFKKDYN